MQKYSWLLGIAKIIEIWEEISEYMSKMNWGLGIVTLTVPTMYSAYKQFSLSFVFVTDGYCVYCVWFIWAYRPQLLISIIELSTNNSIFNQLSTIKLHI